MNRRRVERVHMVSPLPAEVRGERVFILDASLRGFRIAHEKPFGRAETIPLHFDFEGERISADCHVVRTTTERVGREGAERTIHHSGLEILSDPPPALRKFIEFHVARALDEQKANARGIPPLVFSTAQTGKGMRFVRHEWIGGAWRQLPTSDPKQPRHGFTVSEDLTDAEVRMLQETWQRGDFSARDMLRKMAEISISNPDGIPTRRYMP